MPHPEATSARREALIIATDHYEDPKLRALRAPARDAEELARVLGNPEVGDFNVEVSLNEADHVVRRKLSEFFRDRNRDDLLLLHVSCHGLKDEDGTLYFASANTAVDLLEATAIPSEFVNRQMTKSRSRRIVLLLDCCFGGAFARGMVHRAGESVAIKEEFEGQGRVVLTASRAMEYAFEGDSREGDAQPSIFTAAIVHGLESGEADRDRDSRVSVDELYDYVYDRVRESTPNQTPSKWTFDVHGDLYLARSPFREPEVVELPIELRSAMESPYANVRAGAVEELARLVEGADAGIAAAARIALVALGEDDSKRVSEATARVLGGEPGTHEPVPSAPVPPRVEPAPPPREPAERLRWSPTSRVGAALTWAAQYRDLVAFVGGVLFVVGYFQKASWDTAWYFAKGHRDAIWAAWSPVEAFGLAILVVGALRATRAGRLARESADGLLLGVGVTVCAAMVAVVNSYGFAGMAQLTGLAAIGIGGAGALGLLALRLPESGRRANGAAGAVAGAALVLIALVVNVENSDGSTLISGQWGGSYFLEPLVGAVVALLAALAVVKAPRWRAPTAGALLGVGGLMTLHFIGVVVQIVTDDGAGTLRVGAPLGIVGGLVLAGAGVAGLRARPAAGMLAAPSVPAT